MRRAAPDRGAARRINSVHVGPRLDDPDFFAFENPLDVEGLVLIEERASFSPDALSGMEANLRFGGPETMESKIFGRLSAWQNWIFSRPNAMGPGSALTSYGSGRRPKFDLERT